MKTIKVELENISYPLFIDSDLVSRLGEVCDLYRLPKNRIILSGLKNDKFTNSQFSNLNGFNIIPFTNHNPSKDFKILDKIYNLLPLQEFTKGITLVVLGEDWLINNVGFAIRLLKLPINLVCLPSSFWSMIETSIKNITSLNFGNNVSIFQTNYCPKMVLLDVQFLNSKKSDYQLLNITAFLRQLLIVKSDIFHFFQTNFPNVISTNNSENIQILEELISSRIILYRDKEMRNGLTDFGLRFLDLHRAKTKIWPSPKKSALIVLLEICWRWKVSTEINLTRSEETDSIFSLIEKICVNNKISSEDWSNAKEIIKESILEKQLDKLYLPETIGKIRHVDSVDLKLAKKCIDEC